MLLMLAVTGLTAVNTFNGGFVTMSRFMYEVAREGKLPRKFTYLNDRAVPAVPVVILGVTSLVVAIGVAATGTWAIMVSVCAALEMMIYAIAGFVVGECGAGRRRPSVDVVEGELVGRDGSDLAEQSRRELAISDLRVVRDLVKHLTLPTSETGWDAARALLLLDELGMLETTSLGTATTRQQRAGAAAESIAIILRRHREMSVGPARRGSGRHILPAGAPPRDR